MINELEQQAYKEKKLLSDIDIFLTVSHEPSVLKKRLGMARARTISWLIQSFIENNIDEFLEFAMQQKEE